MTITDNHINNDDNVQELINLIESSPEQYKHLQVFLHRERNAESNQDYEFLMVSSNAFGKVKLLDVGVEDNHVILEIFNLITRQVGNVQIDINDSNPKTFFIRWQDIRKMVKNEIAVEHLNAELLEFEF